MTKPLPLLLLLLLLACCVTQPLGSSGQAEGDGAGGGKRCQALSDSYFSSLHLREPGPYTGRNLAFFLHIPRTAGRTFHDCFLRMGTPPQRLCPNAWDPTLGHLNLSDPQCFLLSSHDDFSVVSMLPEGTSVLTHTRDPVDRFISAYEFAVEVGRAGASRGPCGAPAGCGQGTCARPPDPWLPLHATTLVRLRPSHHPSCGSKVAARTFQHPPEPPPGEQQRQDREEGAKSPKGVKTNAIWPWNHLVPFFERDMHERVQALRRQQPSSAEGKPGLVRPTRAAFHASPPSTLA